ncbi:Helicase associated domain protein [Streptomyces xinghaiensis]|uniref:DEAD/DEAH box helicase n=1 Tax=Streptomyces TaxID=1883 RepID=UPI0004D5A1AD|nr:MULTISPECIES: DEAD/DEAH box helicase [Streptomyces]OFA44224.1 hypothetical protein BEN35_22740 [Streptomyces fradiae]
MTTPSTTVHDAPPLWPHQREAVEAAVAELRVADRTTVVMACGTGKTRVAGETALRLAGHGPGRFLYSAPCLELLSQTLREWRRAFGTSAWGRVIAVCSDKDLGRHRPDLGAEQAVVTRDAAELAELARSSDRLTVVTTYQSVGVISAAHCAHGLAPFDLAIADESHRTAGAQAKPWAAVHDARLLGARRRLSLTATPRLVAGDDVISMDNEKVYGRVSYELNFGKAIDLGLLATYRTVVPVVTDEQVREAAAAIRARPKFFQVGSTAVSPSVLATQIAVLRAAHTYGIRKMITYHNRVSAAAWYSKTLLKAADLLPAGERPEQVWAGHVHGGQSPAERREILVRLRDNDGVTVVSNARVLTEGVDVPEADGVAFIDPRNSVIDTAQALGRALRLGDRTERKIATVLIPVHLSPGQDAEAALDNSSFAPVWQVVRALAAHDETLAARLTKLRRHLGSGKGQLDAAGRLHLPEWLHITGIPVPDGFAAAVNVQMIRSTTSSWEELLGACTAFHSEYGHLRVPPDHVTPSGFPLYERLCTVRYRRKKGTLDPRREAQLNKLGIIWEPVEEKNRRFHDALRAFREEHGHLRVPQSYKTEGKDSINLGASVVNLRTRYTKGELSDGEIEFYESLGMVWRCRATPTTWEQFLSDLEEYKKTNGHLDIPFSYTTPGPNARKLGRQVDAHRRKETEGELGPEDRSALEKIGFVWDAREFRYQRFLSVLRDFKERYGHVNVPQKYVTPEPEKLALGMWVANRKRDHKKGILSPSRVRDLLGIGVELPGKERPS